MKLYNIHFRYKLNNEELNSCGSLKNLKYTRVFAKDHESAVKKAIYILTGKEYPVYKSTLNGAMLSCNGCNHYAIDYDAMNCTTC